MKAAAVALREDDDPAAYARKLPREPDELEPPPLVRGHIALVEEIRIIRAPRARARFLVACFLCPPLGLFWLLIRTREHFRVKGADPGSASYPGPSIL